MLLADAFSPDAFCILQSLCFEISSVVFWVPCFLLPMEEAPLVSGWTWGIWMGLSSRRLLTESANLGLSGLPGHTLGVYSARLAQEAPFLGSPILTLLLHRAGRKEVTTRNFSPARHPDRHSPAPVPTLCRTMAHGARTCRNPLWHLSLLTGCLCTASPLWGSCSWSILSLALFFLHGLQGIQPVSLKAGLGEGVYLGRDVKDLGA